MLRRSALVLLIACGSRPAMTIDSGTVIDDVDAGTEVDAGTDAGVIVDPPDAGPDLDGDGIPESVEAELAARWLPNLSLHPQDDCPLGGIVYRVRPHPQDATLFLILYDHLYERDCGIGGHTGDNEVFAVTVNPLKGVTAMKAIAHQNTLCQKISTCGSCGTLTGCDVDSTGRPRVYASRDKHGSYVVKSVCQVIAVCPDDCASGGQQGVPMVNAGEPGAHLTSDLTDGGFITTDNGWTKTELFHFDPWGPETFGSAGKPSEDFDDAAFETPACQ